jgi:hypothetical protein
MKKSFIDLELSKITMRGPCLKEYLLSITSITDKRFRR